MEHRRQLTRRQLLRPGEEAAGEHLEGQMPCGVGKPDVPQKRCGVAVVEIVIRLGYRHRGQRCGRLGVEPNEVAQPERRAAHRERQRVQGWGARQPAERVAVSGRVDQRIVVDRGEGRQMGVGAAQQRPQVVVLAEERVKAAVHRRNRTVGQRVGPAADPAAEVVARFHDVDTDAPLAEPGGGGQPGDSGTDDDHAGCLRQGTGVGKTRRRGQRLAVRICLAHRCSPPSARDCWRSQSSSTAVTSAKPNR